MSRYQNMSAGCSLVEAGTILGTLYADKTLNLLMLSGLKPCGGTLKNPRYERRLVEQLAAIRKTHADRKTHENQKTHADRTSREEAALV